MRNEVTMEPRALAVVGLAVEAGAKVTVKQTQAMDINIIEVGIKADFLSVSFDIGPEGIGPCTLVTWKAGTDAKLLAHEFVKFGEVIRTAHEMTDDLDFEEVDA